MNILDIQITENDGELSVVNYFFLGDSFEICNSEPISILLDSIHETCQDLNCLKSLLVNTNVPQKEGMKNETGNRDKL